jgi:hypothetical protein
MAPARTGLNVELVKLVVSTARSALRAIVVLAVRSLLVSVMILVIYTASYEHDIVARRMRCNVYNYEVLQASVYEQPQIALLLLLLLPVVLLALLLRLLLLTLHLLWLCVSLCVPALHSNSCKGLQDRC